MKKQIELFVIHPQAIHQTVLTTRHVFLNNGGTLSLLKSISHDTRGCPIYKAMHERADQFMYSLQ